LIKTACVIGLETEHVAMAVRELCQHHRTDAGRTPALLGAKGLYPHRNDMVTGSLVFVHDVAPFEATIFEQFPIGAESADLLTLPQVTDFRTPLTAMRISSRRACKSPW